MIKLSTLLLCISTIFCIPDLCSAQNNVVIHGYAPEMKNGTAIEIIETNPFNSRKPVNIYKLQILNKEFRKQIRTGKGDSFFFKIGEEMKEIYLEPGEVRIDLPDSTFAHMRVTRNKSALEYNEFLTDWKKQPIYNRTRDIQNKWLETVNKISKAEYDSAKVVYEQHRISFVMNRLKERSASYINSLLLRTVMDLIPEKQVVELYNGLNEEAQTNKSGQYIRFNIDSLFINGTVPNFIQSDTSERPVKLKDFLGKYVLIDLWASWCVPCRAEHPNLIKANEKFKQRNFTILGISLDSKRDLWVEAIKKDNLVWTQVSDLQGWDNWIFRKYALREVPSNFLIGPDGKIIARNLRGKDLLETLERVLK